MNPVIDSHLDLIGHCVPFEHFVAQLESTVLLLDVLLILQNELPRTRSSREDSIQYARQFQSVRPPESRVGCPLCSRSASSAQTTTQETLAGFSFLQVDRLVRLLLRCPRSLLFFFDGWEAEKERRDAGWRGQDSTEKAA